LPPRPGSPTSPAGAPIFRENQKIRPPKKKKKKKKFGASKKFPPEAKTSIKGKKTEILNPWGGKTLFSGAARARIGPLGFQKKDHNWGKVFPPPKKFGPPNQKPNFSPPRVFPPTGVWGGPRVGGRENCPPLPSLGNVFGRGKGKTNFPKKKGVFFPPPLWVGGFWGKKRAQNRAKNREKKRFLFVFFPPLGGGKPNQKTTNFFQEPSGFCPKKERGPGNKNRKTL